MKINVFEFCFLFLVAAYVIHTQFGMSVRAHVAYSAITLLASVALLTDYFSAWRRRRKSQRNFLARSKKT